MFNARYFPNRYFAPRYWPKVGATEVAVYVPPQLTVYRTNAGTLNIARDSAGTLTINRQHAGTLEVHQ